MVTHVSDDKILDIKNFKKVDGQTIQIDGKKPKKSKKKATNTKVKVEKLPETFIVDNYEFDEEDFDYEEMLIDENEFLQVELLKETTKRKQLEKILNKLLKESQKKQGNENDKDTIDT